MQEQTPPRSLTAYRPYWAKRFGIAPFLPMSAAEMEARGWDACDVILVTGDVDPAKTVALIRKEYGLWKTGYTAPKVAVEPPQTAQRRIDVPFDGQTLPILCVAFKGPALDAGDRLMVAGSLAGDLAFGETSALYKKLVLDEQRVEELFLRALARLPSADELKAGQEHLQASKTVKQGLEDVLWSLVNTREFQLCY